MGKEAVYRGALENILANVNSGLAEGMVPGMPAGAVWYFQQIRGVCQSALAYEPVEPLAQPDEQAMGEEG